MCPICLDKKVIVFGSETINGQETIPCPACVSSEVKGTVVFSQEESDVASRRP